MGTRLLAMTIGLLDAEDAGGSAFAGALGRPLPPDWPPEFHDADTRAWMRQHLAEARNAGFGAFYILAGDGAAIGTCGFKGPPDAGGRVEIGYTVVPSAQRQGHGRAAVRALLALAFADPRVTRVLAETLPDRPASQRTALACGFVLTGRRPDPELGEILTFTAERPA